MNIFRERELKDGIVLVESVSPLLLEVVYCHNKIYRMWLMLLTCRTSCDRGPRALELLRLGKVVGQWCLVVRSRDN